MIIALKDSSLPISLTDIYSFKKGKKQFRGFSKGLNKIIKETSFHDFWIILKADPENLSNHKS